MEITSFETQVIIPATGFVRLAQILAVIPIGKTSWWNGVKAGRFPQSVKLSPRCTAWKAEDIHALIKKFSESGHENGQKVTS